jgi:hypothetical protein
MPKTSTTRSYKILHLPDGTKKYIRQIPMVKSRLHTRRQPIGDCSQCGDFHQEPDCPLYRDNIITEYTKEEFLKLAQEKTNDEAEKLALSILNSS